MSNIVGSSLGSQEIHHFLLQRSQEINGRLHSAIEGVGVIEWPASRTGCLTEFLCRTIVGQQLSTKVAGAIWGRLRDGADANEMNLERFLLTTSDDELRRLGLSRSKVKATRTVIEAELSGTLDEAHLAGVSHEERCKILTSLWGVGTWSANIVSMFFYDDVDVWPTGDVAAQKCLERLVYSEDEEEKEQSSLNIDEVIDSFAPYRSYLAIAMWRHVDRWPSGG